IVSRNVIVSVGCQDTGWGCNRNSFRILKTNSQTCPTDYNQYTIDGTVPLFISQDTYLCAAAKDRAGNIGFSSVRIDIDVSPPSIGATHTLQPEGERTRLTVTANANDEESGVERIEIYIDNSLVQTCPTTSCQYSTLLNPGNYNYLVKAYDNAGNEASFSRNIYVGVTQYSFEFERGWNLFSLPFRSFTINANSCTENKFFHWDSENRKWETVIGIENLQPVGYWFYTDKKCGIHVTGSDPLSPEDLQLRTGWNQIATLSPAFPTATFQSIKGSCTLNQILYYNSTTSSWKVLSETDRFESYKGYLIKATC
ncbi:MAG: Ig-like domain-containing protein, partial [Candidatus Aenigmatarchaeota archaeon]